MTIEHSEQIIESLKQTPKLIENLALSFPRQCLTLKPSADQFSVLENVCHLRDIEEEGYGVRLRRLLSEEMPLLPDIDGSRLASERDYDNQNLETALNAFSRARENNVRTISALRPDQFSRRGTLEGVGAITLERLLLLMREHDLSHMAEIDLLSRLLSERYRTKKLLDEENGDIDLDSASDAR